MDVSSILHGLVGGALIGIASGAFLVLSGRIAGVSGVLGGMLVPARGDVGWRASFLSGLIVGGIGLALLYPSAFPSAIHSSNTRLVVAGLLVGFGTRLGSGCTSGHGVCGISRLSPRSLVATGTFIVAGAATVLISNQFFGG